jgi:dipeptidyl aminopeptidase/acylaminoacyl peptidase
MRLYVRWTAIGIAALAASHANPQDHAFSVKDDIQMSRFSDPLPDSSVPGSENAVQSPDRRYVAIVTTRGILALDQIESDITIFSLREVSAFLDGEAKSEPKPRTIARIASVPHHDTTIAYAPVIKDLRWSSDGASVYFRGENPNGAYQLYIAKVAGDRPQVLTSSQKSVDQFDVVGNTIVYTASPLGVDQAITKDAINRDARAVTGERIYDVLFPGQISTIQPDNFSIWVLRNTKGLWVERKVPAYSLRDRTYLSSLFPFALSPKADTVVALTPVLAIPQSWRRYETVRGFEHLRLLNEHESDLTNPGNAMRARQLTMINLANGKSVPLINAPHARSLAYYLDESRVAWAPDQKRVIVTNTFLPLDQANGNETSENTKPCAVASVDLPSLRPVCLFAEDRDLQTSVPHVEDVAFGKSDDEALVLLSISSGQQILRQFRLDGGHWTSTSSGPLDPPIQRLAQNSDNTAIHVQVKQTLNEPPTLWVINRRTGQQRQLWNPNPQFDHIRFGAASPYRWKDKSGREWSGVLVKPVDCVPGKQYPLVIQMYSVADGQFITDGLFPTAFAARQLASVGFMVLQINKKPDTLTLADPEIHLEGYRSAIDSLSGAGLIDRTKVGVVGFSWTCWYAIDAPIKDPNLFKAITIADGLDDSYMQYLLFGVDGGPTRWQMERIYGSSPFGAGLESWVKDAPGFHSDQVRSPVRIEANNPASVLGEWELYSSLRMQGKPVDLIYFPHGTHIHQAPLERLESQQGDVDWFRFWLQGYIDPDPTKRAQYMRWQELQKSHVE